MRLDKVGHLSSSARRRGVLLACKVVSSRKTDGCHGFSFKSLLDRGSRKILWRNRLRMAQIMS